MAIPTTLTWEVNASGSASNGGGFDSALSGTDRSQSAAGYVEIEQSAVVGSIQATTTNFKFTLGYTVSAADIGNVVYFASSGAGGLGTVGHYVITNISGTDTWILDRSCGTSGGVPTGIMGGCKAAPADLIQSTTPVVAGNRIWCKGSQTITASTITAPAIAGVHVQGYTTTRGDNSRPTWTLSGSSLTMIQQASLSAVSWVYECFTFDGNTQTSSRGFNGSNGTVTFANCEFKRFTNNAVTTTIQNRFANCEFTSCTTQTVFNGNTGGTVLDGCRFGGNSISCFTLGNLGRAVISHCLFHDGSGATSDYVSISNVAAYVDCINCTMDTAGRHAINYQGNAAMATVLNCLITNCGGYGISTTATNPPMFVRNCAFYSNSSGETTGLDSGHVAGSISLSGDPYSNRSSDDYRLNNTSGAGAACKGAGYPANLNAFATSRNIGAFGTAAAASAATVGYASVL